MNSPAADPEVLSVRRSPHSIEAEQSVLGGLLLDNTAWERIADRVSAEDFYRHEHRLIFQHVARLIDANRPADAVTVFESLRNAGQAEEAGGLAYLNSLSQNTPSAANIRRYGEIVRDRSVLRRLVSVGDEIATTALNPQGKDTKQILDEAEARVFNIAEQGARGRQGFVEMQPLLAQVVERITELFERGSPSDVTGVPTGFVDIDKYTAGLQPGDLIVVAGRPSMGKTTLAVNIGEYVAVEQGLPVAVFSMEMGAPQLALRMLSSIGRIDQQRLRTGRLEHDDWPRLSAAMEKIQGAPIYIDETPALNSLELRARSRRLARMCGRLGLIVIDYLQLMSSATQGENRATEISEISRSLKALAKELQVPVIALSQLNRTVEQRADKRPVMSDLRECVSGDSLVLLADGRRVPIADLVGSTPSVLAISPSQRIVQAEAERVWRVGRKPVFRLVLASGRALRATAEHRVLTGAGWKELGQCSIGDRIALARRIPEPAVTRPWKDEQLILLAHLLGHGGDLRRQPIRYTTASEENSQAVRMSAQSLGATVDRHGGRGTRHRLVIRGDGNGCNPAGVGAWLKQLGAHGQRAHDKRVPGGLFQVPDSQIGLFLKHLWASDGAIAVGKLGTRRSARVYLATCGEGLARDVAALLLRLGIVARLRWVSQSARPAVWTVDVSGHAAQSRFLALVGAFGPRVAPANQLRAYLASAEATTHADTLPVEFFDRVKQELSSQGIGQHAIATAGGAPQGGMSLFRFAPGRDVARDYAHQLTSADLLVWSESDVFWDTVVGIEPQGEEDVFDLTVPGPASWLADGIVSHNSGAIEQDADVILALYREEFYNPDTTDKNVAEVLILKQRNGPTGRINLRFVGANTRFDNLAVGAMAAGSF